MPDSTLPVLCHKCGVTLTPGKGNFYVVRIEAVADPSPPHFTDADLQKDLDAEFATILAQLRDVGERELLDQVYRRVTVHLCGRCYPRWIEDPTG